jgi:hypothetical protein
MEHQVCLVVGLIIDIFTLSIHLHFSERDPPCMYCHPQLSTCGPHCPSCKAPCKSCGSIRMDLYSIPGDKLAVPKLNMRHFLSAMESASASVAPEELTRFIEWTEEFGEEGV